MSRDIILRKRLKALDQLPKNARHPSNIALVNIDDVIEIFHDLQPYTMKRLDDAATIEQRLSDARQLAEKVLSDD